MIVREIVQYRVADAATATPTLRQLGYVPILAPLISFEIAIVERRIVLVEPQGGTLGNPDPNAFMVMVPPSFTVGAIFGIELLGTDWESEGFAVGDVVDMAMGPVIVNSILLRATITGISGTVATFRIDNIYNTVGTLDNQAPFPLVAFLSSERFTPKAALLRAGDSGFISPLNGQPFHIAGHADHIRTYINGPYSDTPLYNLRYYDAAQESVISTFMPSARNFKIITFGLEGTQFYAYRTALNPQANTPTSAYPTRGRIILEAEAPNPLRNISFETECILLHPNRLGETTNFIAPGTLTISGGSGSISAPSVPSPVRQAICLLGPDSHHSLANVQSSIELTYPAIPPGLPPSRQGADYVGVVTGQVSGEWVAVMTNKVPSATPAYNLEIISDNLNLARYDSIVLTTTEDSARLPGTYTVILWGFVGGRRVQLASYELNVNTAVQPPLPDKPNGTEILGMLFPFECNKLPSPFDLRTGNYDTVIYEGHPTLGTRTVFYVPIPSAQEPPALPVFIQPDSGYLRDLWSILDTPQSIVAQVICPDGTLLESAPKSITPQPRPDVMVSTVYNEPGEIKIEHPSQVIIDGGEAIIYCRVALFAHPAGHSPIDQAMLFARENYTTGTIIEYRNEDGNAIEIFRGPLTSYRYLITIAKANIAPGRYVIHVRSEMESEEKGRDYESFLYEFIIDSPGIPTGRPIEDTKCKVNIPALPDEEWEYIANVSGSWRQFIGVVQRCSLDRYCGCFERVPVIPSEWIDIIGHFRGAIKGERVIDGAKHKSRFRGRIIRLDDEYTTESFISSAYSQEDIVRAYSSRYQVEIFADTPCDLYNIDILKFAAWWDIVNRSNKMLPDTLYYLRPAEISIADDGEHAKVTITLHEIKWRDEYRRQG